MFPPSWSRTATLAISLAAALAACSYDRSDRWVEGAKPPPPQCVLDAHRCSGSVLQRCVAGIGGPLFEREEIAIAVWYPDRVGAAAAKGLSVATAFPKEGAIGILPTVSVPEGAKNKALAQKYIDQLLRTLAVVSEPDREKM